MMNATRTTLVALIAMALGAAHALPVVQKTLPLGNNTQGIATDPGLARVFITNFNDGTGTAVNVNALTVDDTVPIGANPRRLIADAAHHRVYVVMATTPGTLLIADSAGAAGIVYVPVGNNPRSLGANLPLGEVYVSNLDSNSVSVVSAATSSVIATIPVGTAPAGRSGPASCARRPRTPAAGGGGRTRARSPPRPRRRANRRPRRSAGVRSRARRMRWT